MVVHKRKQDATSVAGGDRPTDKVMMKSMKESVKQELVRLRDDLSLHLSLEWTVRMKSWIFLPIYLF